MQDEEWKPLQGMFLINSIGLQASISIEGPPNGVDILVNTIILRPACPTLSHSSQPVARVSY